VHGLLHLQGYDDHTAADARAMHRREDELLTAAGFGAVFGRGTTRARR
jgi:ssRNA-specific RNase YbeY (16S rRNA maturation enzyme)